MAHARNMPEGPFVILGAGGMLATAWQHTLEHAQCPHVALTQAQFELTDPANWATYLPHRGGVVINCAAYTDVDGAEVDTELAEQVNGHTVGDLARFCAERDTTLVHYSTDYVFNGAADRPYPADAPTDPCNAYGRSKLIGEQAIAASGCRALVVRTSWLYAPWGNNFVRTIHRLAGERDSLRVVDDQLGRPTSAVALAANSLKLLELEQAGTFHVTDGGQCSWYELARAIVELSGARCEVEPCTTDEFPRPATRPAYSVLSVRATESLVGPLPHWRAGVADTIKQL